MKKYDFIIVGSGLYGLTFNYLARQEGYSCLIIERRKHIGGNIYTPVIDGIPIHQYGPHIFHTDKKEIWDFVCSHCEMEPYINSPIAMYYDEVYNLPFNMNTFSKMFNITKPEEAQSIIDKEINDAITSEPSNLKEQAISLVGTTIYEKLVKGYTEKQWGKKCEELPKDIIKRLPYRLTYDTNYYSDRYQGIPKNGYEDLINNLLGDTEVVFCDFLKNKNFFKSIGEYIIYTGPIDEYFNFSEGVLEWRSVNFNLEKHNTNNFQGAAIVNFTSSEVPYTRSIEHKFLNNGFKDTNNITYVSQEIPVEWKQGMEPYYPINTKENNIIYSRYKQLSELENNVIFGGRLGEYKYFDMDDVIFGAMKCFEKIKKNKERQLNIWVISHKNGEQLFNYNNTHNFLRVGAIHQTEIDCFHKDNVGFNISDKNPNYCELTGLYWVWKNNIKSEYVGFEHYRRHFPLSEKNIIDIFQNKDIILPKPYNCNPITVYEQFIYYHNEYDIKTLEIVVKDIFPEYTKSWDTYISNGDNFYAYNMFIVKWEKFEEICNFVFKILETLEKRYNIKNNNDWEEHMKLTHAYAEHKNNDVLYQRRMCGFFAERLVSLWVLHNISTEKIEEIDVETVLW